MNRPYLLLGILALVAFVLSFGAGYHVGSHRPVEVVRDTVEVVRVDTIVVEKPVAVYAYCNLHGLWKTELGG